MVNKLNHCKFIRKKCSLLNFSLISQTEVSALGQSQLQTCIQGGDTILSSTGLAGRYNRGMRKAKTGTYIKPHLVGDTFTDQSTHLPKGKRRWLKLKSYNWPFKKSETRGSYTELIICLRLCLVPVWENAPKGLCVKAWPLARGTRRNVKRAGLQASP